MTKSFFRNSAFLIGASALTLVSASPRAAGVSGTGIEDAVHTQDSPTKPRPVGMIEMLTPTEGVDFGPYMTKVYSTTKKSWFANLPPSVKAGERGKNTVQFRILRNGSVPKETCVVTESSSHEDLDAASVAGIRGAAPFGKLPEDFTADYIELRMTFYYNEQPNKP